MVIFHASPFLCGHRGELFASSCSPVLLHVVNLSLGTSLSHQTGPSPPHSASLMHGPDPRAMPFPCTGVSAFSALVCLLSLAV